jgi:lipopolysaccharide transport system permease protein
MTRDLLWTLVRTDFKSRYHPTIGGFMWALLKPCAMFLVLLAVSSLIATLDARARLNLLIGVFLWDFFAEATKVGLTSLHAKSFLLAKAHVRSWILVVASISNALITLAVFCVVILTFLVASGRAPSPAAMALFAVYLAHYVAIVAGFSLAASVLFLRYRDLNQVWDMVTQAGFFVAPIVYPLAIVPEIYRLPLHLWPPTPVIQLTRAALVDGAIPTLHAHALLTAGTVAILGAGILVFRRLAPRAAEYV